MAKNCTRKVIKPIRHSCFRIKTEANNLDETQIRFQYADVIETFSEIKYELIDVIKRVHNNISDDKEVFTPIRKILEWVMIAEFNLQMQQNSD